MRLECEVWCGSGRSCDSSRVTHLSILQYLLHTGDWHGSKAWDSALFLAQKWPLSIEVKVQVGSCHSLSRDVAWLFVGEPAEVQRAVNELSTPMEKLLCPWAHTSSASLCAPAQFCLTWAVWSAVRFQSCALLCPGSDKSSYTVYSQKASGQRRLSRLRIWPLLVIWFVSRGPGWSTASSISVLCSCSAECSVTAITS